MSSTFLFVYFEDIGQVWVLGKSRFWNARGLLFAALLNILHTLMFSLCFFFSFSFLSFSLFLLSLLLSCPFFLSFSFCALSHSHPIPACALVLRFSHIHKNEPKETHRKRALIYNLYNIVKISVSKTARHLSVVRWCEVWDGLGLGWFGVEWWVSFSFFWHVSLVPLRQGVLNLDISDVTHCDAPVGGKLHHISPCFTEGFKRLYHGFICEVQLWSIFRRRMQIEDDTASERHRRNVGHFIDIPWYITYIYIHHMLYIYIRI